MKVEDAVMEKGGGAAGGLVASWRAAWRAWVTFFTTRSVSTLVLFPPRPHPVKLPGRAGRDIAELSRAGMEIQARGHEGR